MLRSLEGKNAILTGGSQGIGPYIARALVDRGVNVVLVARSKDKLEAAVAGFAGSRCKVVAVDVDLTAPGAADAVVRRSQEALGPIQILVNNAGVENGGRFARKSVWEIEQVLATNLSAPLLLTQRLLPDMLERGEGHVVSIASLAGKMALPYAATYSATKAALMAWSASLRVELQGTGVSSSVVTPGFIAEAGMFASHGVAPPSFLGQIKPEAVAEGVIRALQRDLQEVVVSQRPTKPLQLLYTIAPNLVLSLMDRVGLFRFLRRNFDSES